ncbi:MAG: hypothetical protein ACLGIT_05145 [Gammaproteobacteria bacterium]|uniref:hypothetical protein n=1 Tax=Azohydromonas sp. TaxID=1872666 RepID=UPI002B9B9ACF|nr:hypothetical protein [Azohydromonas sp.]HMM85732.1 hypothetical protein [Azohydromonas sp.]
MSTFRDRLSQIAIDGLAVAASTRALAALPGTVPAVGALGIHIIVGALAGAPVVSRLALHVLAALYHRCVLRDRPMARVGLGRA